MNKNEKKFLWFIFFLALTLRISYLLFIKNTYFFYGHPSDDVSYYKNWAAMIVFGESPTQAAFSGMPLFPYYLSCLFRICGGHWLAVNVLNLILGSLNCVLIYLVAKKIFSQRCAQLAALLASTNFILIYYDWLMMPVTLLITLSLVILLALSGEEPRSFKDWLLLGFFIGIAALGDAKFLIFGALLLIYLLWTKRKGPVIQIIKMILPLTLGMGLILGGVTLRNKIVSGEWIFITSQSGLSLYVGNNADASGAFENPGFIRPSHTGQDEDQRIFVEKALGKKISASQVSDFYRREAVNFITQHPGEYLRLLGKKFILFVSDAEQSHDIDLILQRPIKLRLDWNPYILIFPLALFGMTVSWKMNRETRFAILMVAGHFIYCLIYFVTTRQRAPILPILLIFQSWTFVWIAQNLHERQYKTLFSPVALVIFFAIFFRPQYLNATDFAFLNYSKRGSVYDEHKNFKASETAYLNALKIAPTDSNTLFNLGTSYTNQNKLEKAKECYIRSIHFGKFNVDATFNLGYIYEQTGETAKALEAYQEVLNITPDSADVYFRLANLYQNEGQCLKAKPYYEKIIQLKPILKEEVQKMFSLCK